MTSSYQAGLSVQSADRILAAHEERIKNLEAGQRDDIVERRSLADKLDQLKMWMMGTLAAAVAGLLAQLIGKH
jgi:hypothetical protein